MGYLLPVTSSGFWRILFWQVTWKFTSYPDLTRQNSVII